MILDAFFYAMGFVANFLIGGLIRQLGNPVTINSGVSSAVSQTQESIYLVNTFLPIEELSICLAGIGIALGTWAMFKLTMWILDLLRIGKSYQE